jgi:hypothetical protein
MSELLCPSKLQTTDYLGMGMMSWIIARYEIMMETGPVMVTGVRNGPLAVRRVFRRPKYFWTVDHLPSGMSLNGSVGLLETEKRARLAVEELLRFYQNWEWQNWFADGSLERELQMALGCRIRAELDRLGLRGIPDERTVVVGEAVWLNGYASIRVH